MRNLTLSIMALAVVLVISGCGSSQSGEAQTVVNPEEKNFYDKAKLDVVDPQEIDLVEQMASLRTEYYEALKDLNKYYISTGNYTKTQWSNKEIEGFNNAPQYTYVSPAQIADVKPGKQVTIPEATNLFREATQIYDKADRIAILPDKEGLRLALSKFNQVIAKYPNSDVVDDAAYEAGTIYEKFKDYDIALYYFQKALEWNPEMKYPVRFRIAYLLDRKFGMSNDALPYYKSSMELEKSYTQNYEFAAKRVEELMRDKRRAETRKELQ